MFLMTLALSLGKSLRELAQDVGASELRLWRAFYRVQPFGPDRGDYAVAINSMVIARLLGRRTSGLKTDAFLPKFGPKPQQTGTEMVGVFKHLCGQLRKTHPGSVRRRHG